MASQWRRAQVLQRVDDRGPEPRVASGVGGCAGGTWAIYVTTAATGDEPEAVKHVLEGRASAGEERLTAERLIMSWV